MSAPLARGVSIVPPQPLSAREFEVLGMAAQGRTNGQIAAALGITVHAVKFHLASTFRKLGVANRTEAAVAFMLRGDGLMSDTSTA